LSSEYGYDGAAHIPRIASWACVRCERRLFPPQYEEKKRRRRRSSLFPSPGPVCIVFST